MRILPLQKSPFVYSCNAYLILGDWNRVEDVNTLIDPGTDGFVLDEIARISTGLGKVAVEQVLLTHNHFDHAAGVPAIKERFGAKVLAFTDGPGVDELLVDGQFVRAGNDWLEVIYTPAHSSDSICLHAPAAKALFSGDTQLKAHSSGDAYCQQYLSGLTRLASRSIEVIYSGHDAPITTGCEAIIREILRICRNQSN